MFRAVVALGVSLLLVTSSVRAESVLAGEWKVAIDLPGEIIVLDLRVDDSRGAASVAWRRDPATGLATRSGESEALVQETLPTAFAVNCTIDGESTTLHGRLAAGHAQRGDAQVGDRVGVFRMYRLADMPPDYESQFVGSYRFPDGRLVVVTWNEHGHLRAVEIGGDPSMFTDLQPISQSAFASASELRSEDGPSNWVVFTRNRHRRVDGMALRDTAGQTAHAQRVELFHQERVTVPSDGAMLSGTLLTPVTPGPHPGVVLVHGVEVTHRTELLPEAVELVQKGLAVLIYDLRGHAASSGEAPSMVEMASDALAALTYIQSLDGVSTTEGGLLLAQKHLETNVAPGD